MTDTPPPDPAALLRDWQTIWQNEWAAMATDREALEGIALAWGGLAALMQTTLDTQHAGSPPPKAGPAPRPATAAAPSGPGRDEIDQLSRRVAELERRLEELSGTGAAKPRKRAKRA